MPKFLRDLSLDMHISVMLIKKRVKLCENPMTLTPAKGPCQSRSTSKIEIDKNFQNVVKYFHALESSKKFLPLVSAFDQ